MMIFLLFVTLFVIIGLGIMGYVVVLFVNEVFTDLSGSRNSTSESELRNPLKRNNWG